MEMWFTAIEKFNSESGEGWNNYIQWAKLPQIVELISLDKVLRPYLFVDLTEEDWKHNVHQDNHNYYFRNLDYVIGRVNTKRQSYHIVAVCCQPDYDPRDEFVNQMFSFCGYDLVEDGSGISALTNCGGFQNVFANEELSNVGLLTNFERAKEVQKDLLQLYPDEPHANCLLWAIWKLK